MKSIMLAAFLILAMIVASCGGEEPAVEEQEEATAEEAVEENAGDISEGVPEPVEVVVLYPEGTIDPATVTPDQVLSAGDLNASCFAWAEREVTIAGYPSIWYGDSMVVEDELGLVMDPEEDNDLVAANFDENPGQSVYRGEIVAVRGVVEEGWNGPELNSAVIAEAPADLSPVETSPWVYDDEAIPADQFVEMFNVWNGMEVTVEGYYISTTTSTLNDGVTVRVDLGASDDHYNKVAACRMTGEIPEEVNEAMVADRNMVQIRGTVSGELFGAVGLENCEIVNR